MITEMRTMRKFNSPYYILPQNEIVSCVHTEREHNCLSGHGTIYLHGTYVLQDVL